MARQLTSKKRAQAFSTALFFIGLAILTVTQQWWPGIMLAIGLPLALRQYLLGRTYDMSISLLVFLGTFVTVQFDISWQLLLPVLFTVGAIYTLAREFLTSEEENQSNKKDEED